MAYDAKAIANYFLERAKKEGQSLTQMKLHKLVYYAHGWHLGITGKPLIDGSVEAWQYGPLIPDIRAEFQEFGSNPIDRLATTADDDWNLITPHVDVDDRETVALLDRVWKVYGDRTAAQLSAMTHETGSPWDIIWQKACERGKRGEAIPDNLIQKYFQQRVNQV